MIGYRCMCSGILRSPWCSLQHACRGGYRVTGLAWQERQRTAAAELKYEELLADYRRTLQILPTYEADNEWLL